MEASERLSKVIEYSGLNPSEFAVRINAKTKQAVYDLLKGKTKTISPSMKSKILSSFPQVNKVWLLTGEGEMLNPNSSNVTINGNENQNNIGGQNIKISLPEVGTQKIIHPDGSIEIQNSGLGNKNSNEINRLKEELHLKEIELAKCEAIIKSKDDMICMLKEILDRH